MNKLLPILLICLIFSACKKKVSTKQEDEQRLNMIYQQIKSMSEQVACTNEADWRFVAYSEKSCGGAIAYIPYSIKIDVPVFLKLINQYREYQQQYNDKWGIVSDCMAIPAPKSVTCENGKPKLVF